MAWSWIVMLLFGGGFLGQQLEGPPRDLASLLDPQTALQQMEAATDEAALIALLTEAAAVAPEEAALRKAVADLGARDFQVRQAAARVLKEAGIAARPFLQEAAGSDDPEVSMTARKLLDELKDAAGVRQRADTDYVKKLMAVRLLQATKSQKALPALRRLAMGRDVTLADAAKVAVAVIEGKPEPRPSGQDALEAICEKLPADTAFLALMDVERGARAQTLTDILAVVKKAMEAPEIAPMMQMMGNGAAPGAMLDQMLPKVRRGVIDALARAGNIRVDAVAMVIPGNVRAEDEETFYVAWVFKGLCDPQRLGALCAGNRSFRRNRTVEGHTLYVDRGDVGVCPLDEHTLVLAAFPKEGLGLDALIRSLVSDEKGNLPAVPGQALEIIRTDDVRIALAGTQMLAPDLQAKGRRVISGEIERTQARADFAERPHRQLEVAALQTALAALDLEQLVGHMTTKGGIVLRGTSNDEPAAAVLDKALKAVDAKFRAMLQKEMGGAPEPMRKLIERMAGNALWTTETDGKQVILRANLESLNIMPMMLGFTVHAGSRRTRAVLEAKAAVMGAEMRADMAAEQALHFQMEAQRAATEAAARAALEAKRTEMEARRQQEEARRKAEMDKAEMEERRRKDKEAERQAREGD